jgi:hypothetical protein
MTHDTFGTKNLDMLACMVWEGGWDYVRGTLYRRDYRGGELLGNLELRDGYYAMVATANRESV